MVLFNSLTFSVICPDNFSFVSLVFPRSLIWRFIEFFLHPRIVWTISSHLSTLYGFTSELSTLGRSFDLKDFVGQHKGALDKVITQIKDKLCKDIIHIEGVLRNSTKEISEKVPVILSAIEWDLRSEISSMEMSLEPQYRRILEELQKVKQTYDKLKGNFDGHHKRLKDFVENYILVFEGLKRYLDYLGLPDPIKATHIYMRRLHNGEKNDIDNLIKELNKFLFDKTFRSIILDTGIKAAKEIKTRASEIEDVLTENHMDFTIPGLDREDAYGKEMSHLRLRINELKGILSQIEEMRGFVRRVRGLAELSEYILGLISNARKMKGSLKRNFVKFIEGLPYTRFKLSDFRKELDGMKRTLKDAIGELNKAVSLIRYLRLMRQRTRFRLESIRDYKPDKIGKHISELERIKHGIRNEVIYIRRELGRLKIKDLLLGKLGESESFGALRGIQGSVLNKVESKIKDLNVIQTIQEGLVKIKKKKDELSSSKSNIVDITNVESGITQLKLIRGTIETFSSIATEIESLESTYHFELRTSLDIGGEVKGLISIIPDIVKLKSHVYSYIKFLEKIKGFSTELETIYKGKSNLPSIGDISYRLGLSIWQIIDDLCEINSNVSEMNMVITTIININTILIMMYFRLP